MFILRCSATVGYTRYAISTTIERTFSGCRCRGDILKARGDRVSVCKEQSYESVLRSEFVKFSARVSKCEDVESVII
jgi:hypothetical protein